MEIEAKVWALSAYLANRVGAVAAASLNEAVHVRSFVKQRGQGVIEDNAEVKIRPSSFEQPQCGGREDGVSQGAKTDDDDGGAKGKCV